MPNFQLPEETLQQLNVIATFIQKNSQSDVENVDEMTMPLNANASAGAIHSIENIASAKDTATMLQNVNNLRAECINIIQSSNLADDRKAQLTKELAEKEPEELKSWLSGALRAIFMCTALSTGALGIAAKVALDKVVPEDDILRVANPPVNGFTKTHDFNDPHGFREQVQRNINQINKNNAEYKAQYNTDIQIAIVLGAISLLLAGVIICNAAKNKMKQTEKRKFDKVCKDVANLLLAMEQVSLQIDPEIAPTNRSRGGFRQ